jgi:ABC-2 type transport system permease protein
MRQFTNNLRIFWQSSVLSYIALFRWLRPQTYLASKVAMPLWQMLFFTFIGTSGGGQSTSFYVIGNAVQITAVSAIFGVTMSVGGDRNEGTLVYLFGTPANRLTMFVGRGFIHIIDGVIGVGIAFLWGIILLHLDLSHTDLLALILTILITTFSTTGLGLLMGCMSLVTLNVMLINNTVYFLLLVFSGANVVITQLPQWMQSISQVLPLTRGIAAARALIDGVQLSDVAPLLAGELVLGVVYITIGYVMFRWFEVEAKRRGTLEAF